MPLANHASRVIHLYHKELCELACFHHFISELIVQNVLNNVQENDETEHDFVFNSMQTGYIFVYVVCGKITLENLQTAEKKLAIMR